MRNNIAWLWTKHQRDILTRITFIRVLFLSACPYRIVLGKVKEKENVTYRYSPRRSCHTELYNVTLIIATKYFSLENSRIRM